MDVLQVKNSNGHVGTEDEYEQDEVSEVYNDINAMQCNLGFLPSHLETSSNMKTMPTMWRTRRNSSTTTQYRVFRLI